MAAPAKFDIAEIERRMRGAQAKLKDEFAGLRTGRASANLLDAVKVEAYGQRMPVSQVGTINVSVGFTQIKEGDTPSSAFERADRAVYWAKAHGRNQVRNHGDLMASGDLVDESKVGDVELF